MSTPRSNPFTLRSSYQPAGDQPQAIEALVSGIRGGMKKQTLLGATGTGKSVTGATPVLIRRNGKVSCVSIGSLIDELLSIFPGKIKNIDDTELLEVNDLPSRYREYEAYSIDSQTKMVSWKPINQFTRHASPKELSVIRTSCGREVTVTQDHNFYVVRKGKTVLCSTDELRVGDFLPVPLSLDEPRKTLQSISLADDVADVGLKLFVRMPNFASAWAEHKELLQSILPYQKAYRILHDQERVSFSLYKKIITAVPMLSQQAVFGVVSRGYEHTLEIPVTEELMRLIGYYIAEGHGADGFFMFSSGDREAVDDFSSICVHLGLRYRLRPGTYDYQVSSTVWTEWLKYWCGNTSRMKRLPSFWAQLSNNHLRHILKAYFSGDGGIDSGAITCVTVSKGLASDLLYALSRFGIVARMKKRSVKIPNQDNRTDCWKVFISGKEYLEIFQENIGFSITRKNDSLRATIAPFGNTNVNLIPIDGKQIKDIRQKLGLWQKDFISGRSHMGLIESGKRLPSRNCFEGIIKTLFKAAKKIGLADVSAIEKQAYLLNSYWTPIEKIEMISGEKYVYDFSIDQNETFLAGFGGIFVHNTFTMAQVIQNIQQPTLVIAHNKTLAAQLAQEFQEFFPDNAVHYFVSYYDYYQPEAYMPITDTYIEKDAQINEEIDRLRHASTQSLLTRRDVIIVASVSCIYGLGSPEEYQKEHVILKKGDRILRPEFLRRLIGIFFERTNADLTPGTFRSLGNRVDIMPVQERVMYSLDISGGEVRSITGIDPVSQKITGEMDSMFLFPAKHFVSDKEQQLRALQTIRAELEEQLAELNKQGKLLEADRLKRRTQYDLAMIEEIGYCSGIENYSRHFSGKKPGEAPDSLLEYFPKKADGAPDFLTLIDESHVTLPQLRAMYAGDQARKGTLIDFGFRLPSALDNRPMRYEEFEQRVGQTIYVSATPSVYEREVSEQVVQQVIRPTGLIDPEVTVRPVREAGNYPGQIWHFIGEAKKDIQKGGRVLATTLTKKMAEDLTTYLKEQKVKAEYLHSDVKTIDRIRILTSFRKGEFDCLVGVNLLREGLDLPEVTFIGILDADKEGFLRSETSLIQIIGRAARNVFGRVNVYADTMTGSLERAISETDRRRAIQIAYNEAHGITPQTISKKIHDITEAFESEHQKAVSANILIDEQVFVKNPEKLIKLKEKQMKLAVKELDFETAAILRDEIIILKEKFELM
ncbi:MAG: excinuclease ABC subunit UvrB [Candidatus Moranbacteria bacterium]|nr:excinuclease ABC subunit UvrB [Candidatus Moranbacteria bacterium]